MKDSIMSSKFYEAAWTCLAIAETKISLLPNPDYLWYFFIYSGVSSFLYM